MVQLSLLESPRQKAQRALLPEYQDARPKLTLTQVEEYLHATQALGAGPCRKTIVGLLEEGTLRGVRFGKLWLVDRRSLAEFLRSLDAQLEEAA